MGRSIGRLLLCFPPALAAGLFFLGDSSSGIEPDSNVQLVSASAPPARLAPAAQDILPGDFEHAGLADGPKYVGAAGCAAANCHGGDGLNGVQGSEHSIWIQKDPHAGAYELLLNKQSRSIIKLLKASPRYKNLLANREAHQTRLCLDCHSVAPHESRLAHGHKFSLRDGVSCEGCHGPAEKWLDAHKRPDWEGYTAEYKEKEFGFYNTDKLSSRARICAECHIGSKDKEVNHDLMAAGHPRLTFEMSAYSDNLPPHWNPNHDRRASAVNPGDALENLRSSFDAKLWMIGQLAVAEKTVELLEKRASSDHAVWPEFTEIGCFACHHNLQSSNWRQKRGFSGRRPGSYPWATWQFPILAQMSPHLLQNGQPNPFLGEDSAYHQLQKEMSRPIPNKDKVAIQAAILRSQLKDMGDQLDEMSVSESQIQSLLQAVTSKEGGQKWVEQNWDAAAQTYLAAVALYQGLVDVRGGITMNGEHEPLSEQDNKVYQGFRVIRDLLKFPEESTHAGKPTIYNSPKTFEETAPNPVDGIQSQLDGINQAVKP